MVLAIAIVVVCALMFSFKPTETNAYGWNGSSGSSADPESSTSSLPPADNRSSSSSEMSSSEIPVTSSVTSSVEPVTPNTENNPRLDELKKRLVYDENWKMHFSERQKQVADESLFVGDSICMGFATYGAVDWKNVYAAGSVGARNLFDSEIKYYGEIKPYDEVLKEKNPKRVFTWMGMNDVNISTADVYAKDYKEIIDYTLENSDAEVIVCAMTHVNSDFTPNDRIDEFNSALRSMIRENYTERVRFVDFAYVFTDSRGMLCDDLDAGDGIHLVPDVYYLSMIEICDQLGIPS